MLDVVCAESPPPGERIHAAVSLRAGGSAANAALAAIRAGASARVIGRIGADRPGDLVEATLAERGVEPVLARDAELPTGSAVALLGGAAPSVVANRGANASFSPGDVPHLVEADALFVSGFALLQQSSAPGARAALERFRGQWAAVDLGSPGLAGAATDDVMRGANVVLGTADEARALTGSPPEEAARALASRFEVVCVKLGEDGVVVAHRGRVVRRSAERVVHTAPFGAGDAFGAALLVALAVGEDVVRAAELACEAGARTAAGH